MGGQSPPLNIHWLIFDEVKTMTKQTRKQRRPLEYRCTIVTLTANLWSNSKVDKAASEIAADVFDTTSKWGRVQKTLVDPDVLKEINKLVGQARNYLKGTSPGIVDGKFLTGGLPSWDGKGSYLLPNAIQKTVMTNLARFKERYEELLQELADRLPSARVEAQHEANGLWKDDDVDVADVLARKFRFEFEEDAVPSGDVRCEMSAAWKKDFEARVQEKHDKKLSQVSGHALSATAEALGHFAEKCEEYDENNKKKSPFRDSTVIKVRTLVENVRALNVTDDPKIEDLARSIEKIIAGTPEDFRSSGSKRTDAAKKARELGDNLNKMFG